MPSPSEDQCSELRTLFDSIIDSARGIVVRVAGWSARDVATDAAEVRAVLLQADVEDLAQARDFLLALLIEAEGRGDTDLAARAERWRRRWRAWGGKWGRRGQACARRVTQVGREVA